MKKITHADIVAMKPCKNPLNFATGGFSFTVLELLKMENIPVVDRMWVVMHPEILPLKIKRKFLVWCGRQSEHNLDEDKLALAKAAEEKYLKGEVTDKELRRAYNPHWSMIESSQTAHMSEHREKIRTKQLHKLISILEGETA